jgi:catechol 2,3-dioxygenase-like lactoylglutathione lyase family enzyme
MLSGQSGAVSIGKNYVPSMRFFQDIEKGDTMTFRFNHVHLICRKLEPMINFFCNILGAKLIARRKFRTADGATLDLEGTAIYLREGREDDQIQDGPAHNHYGYSHIGLEVDDLDAAFTELGRRGFTFTVPPKVSGAGDRRVAFFKGPDDILIELTQIDR